MTLENLLLHREIEEFVYAEAEMLDARQFDAWLDLWTEDCRVFAPITRNVRYDQIASEKTKERAEIAWFDEGKETLRQRVQQIATGLHWAEEPRSRTVHMVSNLRITERGTDEAGLQQIKVSAATMLYRHRGQDETDFMVGRRKDVLVKTSEGWKIRHRELDLAQTVLLAKNLTTFF